MDDVKHEEDYDSEDMDIAPKTERTQHYKKLGTIWVWAFVSGTFFYSFFIEYLYNHYPYVEFFRKPLPPPWDHPDPFTTPDSNFAKLKTLNAYKYAVDSDLVADPDVKLVDGKKVYGRFVGVNQPMSDF